MRLRLLWIGAFGVMVLFGTVGHNAAMGLTINTNGVTSPGVL